MIHVALVVNGVRHEAEVEPNVTLVEFLRESRGMRIRITRITKF